MFNRTQSRVVIVLLTGHNTWRRYIQLNVAMFHYYALQPSVYCAIWVRHSNFRHQASPRVSPRDSTQRRKVELWARNLREVCLNADCHVTFRDMGPTALLPLRRKACWGFFRPKNPTASAGCEPANLSTKDQHVTSRPPKPLIVGISKNPTCWKCGTEEETSVHVLCECEDLASHRHISGFLLFGPRKH